MSGKLPPGQDFTAVGKVEGDDPTLKEQLQTQPSAGPSQKRRQDAIPLLSQQPQQQQRTNKTTIMAFDIGKDLNVNGKMTTIMPTTANAEQHRSSAGSNSNTETTIKAYKVGGTVTTGEAFTDMTGGASTSNSHPTTSHSNSASTNHRERAYNIQNPGHVLIINNKFDEKQRTLGASKHPNMKRLGSEKDAEDMAKLFKEVLGCNVHKEENVASFEIEAILMDFKEICKDSDFIVIIIMTHGGEADSLLMHDFEEINLYQKIVYEFNEENFPEFRGKPKIFLVQACAKNDDRLKRDARDTPRPVGELADVFIGKPCLPYGYSWRDEKEGSWYIQSIRQIFEEHWESEDLESLHNLVRDAVVETGINENQTRGPNEQHTFQTPWSVKFDFGYFKFPRPTTA